MISVVFPAYNEEANIDEFHRRLKMVLEVIGEPYEIIAVDDGSQDRTGEKLLRLSPLTVILFARNYGQNAALDAGLKQAKGDIIVTIDSDLQNPPEEIPQLLRKLDEGYDAVVGWRQHRHDSLRRRLFSRLANRITSRVTGLALHDFSCALKVYRREFIEGVKLFGETFVFLPVFAVSRGARLTEVVVAHEPRRRGESKHTIAEMIRVMFDLIAVKFLLSYFGRPMQFFGTGALLSWIVAAAAAGWATALKLAGAKNYSETPLPIFGTLFAIMGVLLFMLGFLVEILLRIYHASGNSSPYSIKKIVENP
jgi:glycosyltransferase involved in cell wall biosynthesis